MSNTRLQRLCEHYGTIYTDCEVVSCAFTMAVTFDSWNLWLEHLSSAYDEKILKAIRAACTDLLNSLPLNADQIRIGVITVEQSAARSLQDSLMIPRSFLERVISYVE